MEETENTTQTTITPAPGKATLDFELTATLHNGVAIPCEVYIVYPEGMGLHAVNAARQAMEQNRDRLYMELLNRRDQSLVSQMLANGAEFEDGDDGE